MTCTFCGTNSEEHNYCCPYGKDQTLTGEELKGYKKSVSSFKKVGNIFDLQKQNAELQDELAQERLTRETLQQEFAKLRYLDRQEVEIIFEGLLGICPVGFELEPFISELCNLALPDRDKIIKVLDKYLMRDVAEIVADEIGGAK